MLYVLPHTNLSFLKKQAIQFATKHGVKDPTIRSIKYRETHDRYAKLFELSDSMDMKLAMRSVLKPDKCHIEFIFKFPPDKFKGEDPILCPCLSF